MGRSAGVACRYRPVTAVIVVDGVTAVDRDPGTRDTDDVTCTEVSYTRTSWGVTVRMTYRRPVVWLPRSFDNQNVELPEMNACMPNREPGTNQTTCSLTRPVYRIR